MDAREQRGLVIAATCKITKKDDKWFVPSQNQGGTRYTVSPDADNPHCTCMDHETRHVRCKHIFAVQFVIEREANADGTTTVTEVLTVSKAVELTASVTVTETVEVKKTYKQDWPAYNAAQAVEKDRVQELLFDLCGNVPEPERTGCGRKPHTVKDSIFSMVYKVYSTFSSRRFSSDLRDAHERGYLSKPIPGMKTVQFFENPELYRPRLKLMCSRDRP